MSAVPNQEALEQLVSPTIAHLGYSLWALECESQRKPVVVRLLCDGPPDQAFSIADCQKVSRQLQGVLDVSALLPESYVLEVSSPGLERPLSRLAHFAAYQGATIALKLKPNSTQLPQNVLHQVILKRVDPAKQAIEVQLLDQQKVLCLPLADIAFARLVLEYQQ